MFWCKEERNIDLVEQTLSKEDLTLEELLDLEEILTSCKLRDIKLINYLTKEEVMLQLVSLVITEPSGNLDEKTRFKYATVACEVLTSNTAEIDEALLKEPVLKKLYGFLNTEDQLNPLLASFFSRLMYSIIAKECYSFIIFLTTQTNFVTLLIRHFYASAVMDFALKLISIEVSHVRETTLQWLHSEKFIPQLVSLFKKDTAPEKQVNAALFLCDMIATARNQQSSLQEKAEKNYLLDEIESTSTISQLLDNIFEARTESSLVNGISVLESLLDYERYCAYMRGNSEPIQNSTSIDCQTECSPVFLDCEMPSSENKQVTQLDIDRLKNGVKNTHDAILGRLNDFIDVLLNPPYKKPIRTTIGVIDVPFGLTRLEVVHLIRALVSGNNPLINQKLKELRALPILIDLFFAYPYNNFLHTHVEAIIGCVIENFKYDESDLLDGGILRGLCKRIMTAWESDVKAYMGHLVKMACSIESLTLKDDASILFDDIHDSWMEFLNGPIESIKKVMATPLAQIQSTPKGKHITESEFTQGWGNFPFVDGESIFTQNFSDLNNDGDDDFDTFAQLRSNNLVSPFENAKIPEENS